MKKYLETEKDVINALKAGKKVFNGTTPYVYKMVDGVICYYDIESNKLCGINAFVSIGSAPYYIEEQAPINIEAGKFYLTRNGKKAYCFYKDEADKSYPNHFVIYGERDYETYTDGGLTFKDGENPEDIVGYWEE